MFENNSAAFDPSKIVSDFADWLSEYIEKSNEAKFYDAAHVRSGHTTYKNISIAELTLKNKLDFIATVLASDVIMNDEFPTHPVFVNSVPETIDGITIGIYNVTNINRTEISYVQLPILHRRLKDFYEQMHESMQALKSNGQPMSTDHTQIETWMTTYSLCPTTTNEVPQVELDRRSDSGMLLYMVAFFVGFLLYVVYLENTSDPYDQQTNENHRANKNRSNNAKEIIIALAFMGIPLLITAAVREELPCQPRVNIALTNVYNNLRRVALGDEAPRPMNIPLLEQQAAQPGPNNV